MFFYNQDVTLKWEKNMLVKMVLEVRNREWQGRNI